MVLVSVTEKRYARSGCPYFLAALRYEPASLSSTKTDRRTLLPLLLNVSDLERSAESTWPVAAFHGFDLAVVVTVVILHILAGET